MNKAVLYLLKYFPYILIAVVLVCVQVVFLSVNLVGIYIFGSLYATGNKYKIFVACALVSLLYDSLKMINFGTWALSFYITALLGEGFLRIIGTPKELNFDTIRTSIILFILISFSAIVQVHTINLITNQTVAQPSEFSIVIAVTLYLFLRKVLSNRKSTEYLRV